MVFRGFPEFGSLLMVMQGLGLPKNRDTFSGEFLRIRILVLCGPIFGSPYYEELLRNQLTV